MRRYPKGIQNNPKLSLSPARYLITQLARFGLPLRWRWEALHHRPEPRRVGSGEWHVASLGLWKSKIVGLWWVYGWENVGLWLRIWIHSWCELDFIADVMIFMAWDFDKVGKWWGYHIRSAKQMWLRQQTVGDLWSSWLISGGQVDLQLASHHDLMLDLQSKKPYFVVWSYPGREYVTPTVFQRALSERSFQLLSDERSGCGMTWWPGLKGMNQHINGI